MSQLPWNKQSKSDKSILVIGDLIFDHYLLGKVSRISPEAPVPVHRIEEKFQLPGGASNVAINCAQHKPKVMLAGRVGNDAAGSALIDQLEPHGIDTSLVIRDSSFSTITKTRVLTKTQQIVRFDEEVFCSSSSDEASKLASRIDWSKIGVVLLSDYGKGFLSNAMISFIVKSANEYKIPCIVDPKGADFQKYAGAYLVTPNRKEAELALGIEAGSKSMDELGTAFKAKHTNIKNSVITLGPQGMLLLDQNGSTRHLAAESKEVFDVAMQKGTFRSSSKKIMDFTECMEQLESKRNRKIVFTNGCFDLLHPGHVDYLEAARAMGSVLVVGVNSDASVKRLKGESRPIQQCAARKRVLAGLRSVDFVVEFGDDTPLKLIEKLKPDVLVKGGDWPIDKIVGGSFVNSYGGTVCNVEVTEGHSTTKIVANVKNNGK